MSVETEPTEIRNMILAVGGTIATWFAGIVGILALGYDWQMTTLLIILWSSLIYTIIALLSRRQTAALASWLEQPDFTDLYKRVVFKSFCWLWRRYAAPPGAQPNWKRSFKAALTHRVYDTALLIAVVYPLILLAAPWLWTGEEVVLLEDTVIREVQRFGSEHCLVLGTMVLFSASGILRYFTIFQNKSFSLPDVLFWIGLTILISSLFLGWVPGVAGVAAGAVGAVAAVRGVDNDGTGKIAAATAIGVSANMPLTSVVPGLVRAGFAAGFAVGVPYLAGLFVDRGRANLGYFLFSITLIATLCAASMVTPWENVSELLRIVFIFFGVFPVINAIFDTLSYALTLSLVRYGLRSSKAIALVFGLIDLVCALALFALLGAAITFGIAGLSTIAEFDLFPLQPIFEDLADGQVDKEHRWVIFMVFSTMIPTGIHLLLTLLSVQGLIPFQLRRLVGSWVRNGASGSPRSVASALIGVPLITAFPFVALYALCWAGWQVSEDVIGAIGTAYLRWLEWIAAAVGITG